VIRVGLNDFRGSSLFLCELDSLNIDLFIDKFIYKGDDLISLDSDQDEAGARSAIGRGVGTGDRAWVDEVLAIILHYLVLVSVPADQDVHIELSLHGS
jgi:hypothetical protein